MYISISYHDCGFFSENRENTIFHLFQTLWISHSTGHVTCNTDHMTPGGYSVMVAVEDTISGIRVS